MITPLGEKEDLPSTRKTSQLDCLLNIQPIFTEPTIYHDGLSKKKKAKKQLASPHKLIKILSEFQYKDFF